LFDTFIKVVVDNIISIVVVILTFIFAYLLFIIKGRHAIPKLEYERISSLSLISMDKRIRDRIKITCDGESTNNIFSFRFRIRNTGKVPIKRIPIVVEFNDENVQILDIKGSFESKDKERNVELSLDDVKKNQGKFIINPGLDKGEEGVFDVFTKGNKTVALASLGIKLGEEALGTQWRCFKKKKIVGFIWGLVIGGSIGAVVVVGVRAEVIVIAVTGVGGVVLLIMAGREFVVSAIAKKKGSSDYR